MLIITFVLLELSLLSVSTRVALDSRDVRFASCWSSERVFIKVMFVLTVVTPSEKKREKHC